MGVPQLMMILEPNIVWDHVKTYSDTLGKKIEASYCPGEFFEGWHKAGRLVSGDNWESARLRCAGFGPVYLAVGVDSVASFLLQQQYHSRMHGNPTL
jgi:hypothetical protein